MWETRGTSDKYGLLRSLCRQDEQGSAFLLGVLWYRFDGDESDATNDGRNIQYLSSSPSHHEHSLRSCDAELFDKMLDLVKNDRSIEAVEAKGVLPPGTVFVGNQRKWDR